MEVSRCRFWWCSCCQAVFEKEDLQTKFFLYGGTGQVTIMGTRECGNCHAVYQVRDIFAGLHDVPRQHWGQLQQPVELTREDTDASLKTLAASRKSLRPVLLVMIAIAAVPFALAEALGALNGIADLQRGALNSTQLKQHSQPITPPKVQDSSQGSSSHTQDRPINASRHATEPADPSKAADAALTAIPLGAPGSFRLWTDSTGKFKVTAKPVYIADGKVSLEKENGKLVEVPIDRLSEPNQVYLKMVERFLQKPSN